MRSAFQLAVAVAAIGVLGCAGTIAPPNTVPAEQAREALLVIPGFGYSAEAERALRAMEGDMRADGLDLYVPDYVARRGLDNSRQQLHRFIREQRLDRYERVHVFAFLAGGWTLNRLAEDPTVLANVATVVYDRSPYQERAPRVAAQKLGPLAWVRYGKVLFDLAKTPYRPLPRQRVKVGIVIETKPTSFIKRFAQTARSFGPYAFACDGHGQPHDDCMFVPLNHTQLYTHFRDTWPDVRSFIRTGRFTEAADRTPPEGAGQ